MKTLIVILAVFFSIATLSGCASTRKKSCDKAVQDAPVASSSIVAAVPAAAPATEPAEEAVPEAAKRYIK